MEAIAADGIHRWLLRENDSRVSASKGAVERVEGVDPPGVKAKPKLLTTLRKRDNRMEISREAFAEFVERKREKALAEEVKRLQECAARLGEDIFQEGAVLRFKKRFGEGTIAYTYATIKAAGKWYLSGPMHGQIGMTWDELIMWMIKGVPVEEYEVLFSKYEIDRREAPRINSTVANSVNMTPPWAESRMGEKYDEKA
jgi:hypothetical protein